MASSCHHLSYLAQCHAILAIGPHFSRQDTGPMRTPLATAPPKPEHPHFGPPGLQQDPRAWVAHGRCTEKARCRKFGKPRYRKRLKISLYLFCSASQSIKQAITHPRTHSLNQSTWLAIYRSLYLSVYLSIDPSTYLPVCMKVCLFA